MYNHLLLFIADNDISDGGMQDKFSNKDIIINHIFISTTKHDNDVFVNQQNRKERCYKM